MVLKSEVICQQSHWFQLDTKHLWSAEAGMWGFAVAYTPLHNNQRRTLRFSSAEQNYIKNKCDIRYTVTCGPARMTSKRGTVDRSPSPETPQNGNPSWIPIFCSVSSSLEHVPTTVRVMMMTMGVITTEEITPYDRGGQEDAVPVRLGLQKQQRAVVAPALLRSKWCWWGWKTRVEVLACRNGAKKKQSSGDNQYLQR